LRVRDFLDIRVICETGSLRKAAAVLGVTQPTLSNRIAHLEDQLGTPLFDRSRGQSQPTDLALFIASRAATMAHEAERLSREVKRLTSGKAGLVRIGLGPAPVRAVFSGVVARIHQRFPQISLEMVSGNTPQLSNALLGGELDIVVCPPLEVTRPEIVSEQLLEAEIVVVARPDHPMCVTPPADIPTMFQYPVAMTYLDRRYLDILARNYGIDFAALPGRIVCTDFEMAVRVVAASPRLFTAGPRFLFQPEFDAGHLAIIGVSVPFGHIIHLHTSRDAHPLPAVTTVLQVIREVFAEIPHT